MRISDLKRRVDAVCEVDPNLKTLIKIESQDGSYSICEPETVIDALFNGLFIVQPEVHETSNCIVITASEMPCDEIIEPSINDDEIFVDKRALEQAYLDGAMDSNQFIEELSRHGYLNLP
jgi:hypothetical protein